LNIFHIGNSDAHWNKIIRFFGFVLTIKNLRFKHCVKNPIIFKFYA